MRTRKSKKQDGGNETPTENEQPAKYDPKVEFDMSKNLISGPYNAVRMEGEIHGVKKVVYMFFDYHYKYPQQAECSNVFSKHVNNYIFSNFQKAQSENKDVTYDFFYEITPTDVTNKGIRETSNTITTQLPYMYYFALLFQRLIQVDADNKIIPSKLFKNVRFHYADVRDYLEAMFTKRSYILLNLASNISNMDKLNLRLLSQILQISTEMYHFLKDIIDIIQNVIIQKEYKNIKFRAIMEYDFFDNIEKNGEEIKKGIEYFLNKIVHKYQNDDIRKQLVKYVLKGYSSLEILEEKLYEYIKFVQGIVSFQQNTNEYSVDAYGVLPEQITERIFELRNKTDDLFSTRIYNMTWIMDVYFLRRILDKSYITNTIVYAGGAHTTFYAAALRKDFGFKVTHASHHRAENLDALNTRLERYLTSDNFFILAPSEHISQCSDMTDFPKNFM